jgi:ABC-type transport system involved in multi-copper enzyme maturation permease subunit
MGIFNDNPVLGRELRARLRLRKLRGNRPAAIFTAFIGLVILWFSIKGMVAIAHGQTSDARDLWSYLVIFLVLLIVVVAPALLSTAVTQEREQQTWEALTATRLTASQVLLGKWLGRLSLILLPILILLPFLIGCAVKGALNPVTFFGTLAFLAATSAGYGSLGLLCSFFARKTINATVTALTLTIGLCIGTPIIAALMSTFVRAASPTYTYLDPPILWINPFYAITALTAACESHDVGALTFSAQNDANTIAGFYFILTLGATVCALLFMISRYRRAARE